jgi:hypothetical protein
MIQGGDLIIGDGDRKLVHSAKSAASTGCLRIYCSSRLLMMHLSGLHTAPVWLYLPQHLCYMHTQICHITCYFCYFGISRRHWVHQHLRQQICR